MIFFYSFKNVHDFDNQLIANIDLILCNTVSGNITFHLEKCVYTWHTLNFSFFFLKKCYVGTEAHFGQLYYTTRCEAEHVSKQSN